MPGACNAGIVYRLPSRRPRGDHDHSHRHAPLNVYRFAPLSSPRGGHVIRTRRLSRALRSLAWVFQVLQAPMHHAMDVHPRRSESRARGAAKRPKSGRLLGGGS